jgi:hypothetical protein
LARCLIFFIGRFHLEIHFPPVFESHKQSSFKVRTLHVAVSAHHAAVHCRTAEVDKRSRCFSIIFDVVAGNYDGCTGSLRNLDDQCSVNVT